MSFHVHFNIFRLGNSDYSGGHNFNMTKKYHTVYDKLQFQQFVNMQDLYLVLLEFTIAVEIQKIISSGLCQNVWSE